MQSYKIFISGTNRGLGKQLLLLLRKQRPYVELHISTRADTKEYAQSLKKQNLGENLHLYKLDLLSDHSISENAQTIKSKNILFDTIVVNAAYGADFGQVVPSYQVAYNTITTNTTATFKFIKQFIPNLAPNGRLVIVSSIAGRLNRSQTENPYPQNFLQTVRNPSVTEQQIINLGLDYIERAKNQDMQGHSKSAYYTSKALLNAWVRFVLPKHINPGQTFINLHPGWCLTDMGGKNAPLTSQEGGRRIYDTIWLPEVDHNLFYNQKFCSYETCK